MEGLLAFFFFLVVIKTSLPGCNPENHWGGGGMPLPGKPEVLYIILAFTKCTI